MSFIPLGPHVHAIDEHMPAPAPLPTLNKHAHRRKPSIPLQPSLTCGCSWGSLELSWILPQHPHPQTGAP